MKDLENYALRRGLLGLQGLKVQKSLQIEEEFTSFYKMSFHNLLKEFMRFHSISRGEQDVSATSVGK